MPRYDYQCEECRTVFEVRATIQEKEDGLQPECPECHSEKTRQLLTAGLMLHTTGSSRSQGGCDPGSGCCG
jgi:putative FmdB family regulatory protein